MNTIHNVREELASTDLMTPDVRAIAKKYYRKVKKLPKEEILRICDRLLEDDDWRQRTIAFQWAFRFKKIYLPEDFRRFERWLDDHVKGWGSCDDLCTHAMGELILQYPELVSDVIEWTSSDNMWKRRAAAVVMVYCVKKGKYLEQVFEVADALFHDEEDLVQKGYGWMLKVASQRYRNEVYDYVMKNKATMPRTALRYSI